MTQQDDPGTLLIELAVPDRLADLGIDRVVAWATTLKVKFRRITVREGVALHGPTGWGEWSPFWDYDPTQAAAWLRAGLEAATTDLPSPRRDTVEVNVTVPVIAPDAAHAWVRSSGATTAKIKVADPASTLHDDLARVEAVRDALGPAGHIRVDANGAWQVDEAAHAVTALDRVAGGLEYVEQPCSSVPELARLRRFVNVPIAADESVRRADDPLAVARAHAADILIIKAQPLGGVRRALAIIDQAQLPAVVSSALDSSIGIALGAHLAACLPTNRAAGLGTATLFTSDVCQRPRMPNRGQLAVGRVELDLPTQPVPSRLDTRGCVTHTDTPPATLAQALPSLAARWTSRLAATLNATEELR